MGQHLAVLFSGYLFVGGFSRKPKGNLFRSPKKQPTDQTTESTCSCQNRSLLGLSGLHGFTHSCKSDQLTSDIMAISLPFKIGKTISVIGSKSPRANPREFVSPVAAEFCSRIKWSSGLLGILGCAFGFGAGYFLGVYVLNPHFPVQESGRRGMGDLELENRGSGLETWVWL